MFVARAQEENGKTAGLQFEPCATGANGGLETLNGPSYNLDGEGRARESGDGLPEPGEQREL